jgi:hypothetical protein
VLPEFPPLGRNSRLYGGHGVPHQNQPSDHSHEREANALERPHQPVATDLVGPSAPCAPRAALVAALRCRIEPYLDQAVPLRAALWLGAPLARARQAARRMLVIQLAHPRFPIFRRRPEPVEGATRRLRRWPAATLDRTGRKTPAWQLSGMGRHRDASRLGCGGES